MTSPPIELDEVQAVVREHVAAIEQDRRLPDAVVEALHRSGLHRLAIPAELGGLEAPVGTTVAAIAAIAATDGSTGWCAAIGAGSNVFAGYLPRDAARGCSPIPTRATPRCSRPRARSTPPAGTAASRAAGRSPATACTAPGPGSGRSSAPTAVQPEPAPRVVFVPLPDLEVENTWFVAGLRGTGSHHVAAHDVAVDLERSCHFGDPAWPAGAVWRLPIYTVLIPMLSAVPVGIARGALDDALAIARGGREARRGQLHDDAVGMAELGVADTELRAFSALLDESLAEAAALVERGDPVDRPLQARILLAGMRACDVAVQATSVAHNLAGAAAVYDGSRLQRALRDVQTARQHQLFSHQHRAPLAAAVAGRDVEYRPFLM